MNYFDTFKDKSDEDLIRIKNQCSPSSEDRIQADIELHKRKTNQEDKSYSLQNSIRTMTFIIIVLTVLSFIVVVYQCEKPLIFPLKTVNVIEQPNNSPHNNGVSQKEKKIEK